MVTAGEVIKNKRETLGKNLNTVSIDTKIQKRFLQYIENNEFDKFDSEIFASGFIKIYSKYLGLDVEKILALYRRSNLKEVKTSNTKTKIKKRTNRKIDFSPKAIALLSLALFFLLIVGYVGSQIYKFQTPPSLTITQPTDEYISEEESLLLKGETENGVLVEVNGEQIDVDSEGFFEFEIELKEGVNILNIKARKASNTRLERSISLRVIYSPSDTEIVEEKEEYLLTLTISQSSSWIKLDIDNENKISQVLQPNTVHEFEVEKKFTLVTGRVQNTKLEINGEDIPLSSSNLTGIGQIECEIVEKEIKCQ